MAQKVGLIAKLQFIGGAAVSGIKKAGGAFGRMSKQAAVAKRGVGQIRQGFGGLALAGLGLGGVVVKTIKDFGKFEFQIAKTGALTKATGKDFSKLESLAKKMGATTFFTASQSAEAMQVLARAGFKTEKIIATLPTVMNLAAAEDISLAESAGILTKTLNAFRLEAKDAVVVADTLAFTSTETATDVRGLGEGLKFVGTTAGGLKIPVQQTAFALGILADVNKSASTGGTALNNALVKIKQNMKNGAVQVGKYSATIERTENGGVNLNATLLNITTALKMEKDELKRSAIATKLLGIRGEAVAGSVDAMEKKLRKMFPTTENNKKSLEAFNKLAKGTAERLRLAQEATALGDWKKFTSALSGVSTELGGVIVPALTPFLKGLTTVLSDTASALGILGSGKNQEKLKGLNATGVQLAQGLREGFKAVKEVFGTVAKVIKSIGSAFGINFGKGQLKDVIAIGMKTGAWLVTLKVATGILGRLGNIAGGTFKIIKGGLGVLGAGTKGVVSLLGTKFPKLAKILPGSLKKLTGAVASAEKITAQPVRVVNFDEAGGALGTGLGATTKGPSKAGNVFRKIGSGAKGAGLKLFGLAKGAGAAIKAFGVGKLGLVGAAGAAGFALGTLIDKTFGLSDKISKFAFEKGSPGVKGALQTIEREKLRKGRALQTIHDLTLQAKRFEEMRKRGVTTLQTKGGRREDLATVFARQAKVRAKAEGLNVDSFVKKLSAQINKAGPIEVKVNLDGREIGKGTSKAKGESDKRRGVKKHAGGKLQERAG
jgi:TP901 family phage tail tape measure protein